MPLFSFFNENKGALTKAKKTTNFNLMQNKRAWCDVLSLFDRLPKKKKVRPPQTPLCQGSAGDFGRRTLRRYFRENQKQKPKAQPFVVIC